MALRQISRATCRHFNRPTLSLLSIYTTGTSSTALPPPSFLLPFPHERPTTIFNTTQRRHIANLDVKFPAGPNIGPQYIDDVRVRFPYDDEITCFNPTFIDEEGKLVGTFPLAQVLRSYDRKIYHLIHISGADALTDESEGHIVRLFAKSLLQQRIEEDRAEAKKRRKSGRDVHKEVQISWGIDPHDLSHHLKKAGKFLGKGNRVEIMIAKKKGKAKVSAEKLEEMMAVVEDFLYYNGGKEVKTREGEVGMQLRLVVQRPDNWVPPPPKPEPTPAQEEGEEGAAQAGGEASEGVPPVAEQKHVPAWQARGQV
ncbi:hypothetical protein H072_3544 [Dactylellina haptotyla CBS 200.50]|uniref:Translation initiation factor 3 C-terminal domain-containing protein n=1 Tax=Dactylellina haptotyla (strain CBS 200.50) TaxID=1284197 RepID=S8AHC5_DACHA|nr:hypothetical protein H072_3544 [Dactylellina haptotyla CBS 200.50]